MRWSGNWHTLGRPVRCVEGRLMRHDPQHDDPDLETDVGMCFECRGHGCDAETDEPAPRQAIPTTCIETIDGDPNTALRLSFQIKVF